MGARNPPFDDVILARLRRRAASVLWIEFLLRAAAPAAFILLLDALAALAGFADGWVNMAALLLALAALGWEGAKIRPPALEKIDRRIEAASGFAHRPLAVFADAPVTGGAPGAAIWQAHRARAQALLAQAHSGWPAPFAAMRDPYSLRAILLLLLVCAAVMAGPQAPARLAGVFALPAWPVAGPVMDVWVTPPAYTGQAPLMLGKGQAATVLTGTGLSVILGGSNAGISFAGAALPVQKLGAHGRRADTVIAASGTLRIGPWWHRLGKWQITAVAPLPPSIRLDRVSLDNGAIKLSWTAADAYGLTALTAALHPLGYPDALPDGAALATATGKGTARLDTSDSPYGGITVGLALQATNLAGRTAKSAAQKIAVPEVALHDPTALVLGIIRQNLALTPGQAPAIARQMRKLGAAPPSAISYAADVQLSVLAARLRSGDDSPAAAVARLLALIRQIEMGQDFAPAQALAQATQALLDALTHGPPDRATLNRLLAAMQQALADHLAAVHPAPPGQPERSFDAAALNRMAEKIAADEAAGRTEQAAAELQQLQAALQALQAARPMTAAQAAQAQAAGQSAANLSSLIQNEAGLRDQTANGNATAAQQSGLQAGLAGLQAQLPKAGLAGLPGLGAAGRAMQDAANALGRQDSAGAQTAETAAIAAMQQAAAALQQKSGGPGQGDGANGLGEDIGNAELTMPGHNAADSIEQEIMRRDADPKLPAATHGYLRRLLTPDQ